MSSSPIPLTSEEIAEQTSAFLKSGGHIKHLKSPRPRKKSRRSETARQKREAERKAHSFFSPPAGPFCGDKKFKCPMAEKLETSSPLCPYYICTLTQRRLSFSTQNPVPLLEKTLSCLRTELGYNLKGN